MEESINLILLGGIDDIRKHGGGWHENMVSLLPPQSAFPGWRCFDFFQKVQPT